METLRAQIAAQIAWSKLVQDALGDRVHVSQLDVDDELARLKRGADKPHYVVSEIFQAVDTPEQDAKVKKDMEDLETQLQAGAPFNAVARQFSQNPTAAQGGDLGAVQEGQLPPELDKIVKTMHSGQISAPIRATGGYYIVLLRELQMPEGAANSRSNAAGNRPRGHAAADTYSSADRSQADERDRTESLEAAAVMRSQIENCTTPEKWRNAWSVRNSSTWAICGSPI